MREGSEEAKDMAASALWSLATDNAMNKDTIAKLGGIDHLVQLIVTVRQLPPPPFTRAMAHALSIPPMRGGPAMR